MISHEEMRFLETLVSEHGELYNISRTSLVQEMFMKQFALTIYARRMTRRNVVSMI